MIFTRVKNDKCVMPIVLAILDYERIMGPVASG